MLYLTPDGRVIASDGREVYTWNEAQHDRICDKLFPGDKVIRNAYLTRKRSKSYAGHCINLERVADMPAPEPSRNIKVSEEKLAQVGGERLLALYRAGMNFGLAAKALGVGEAALRKWFTRWRAEALSRGLKPEDLLG
jgi:hypothetical protein